MRQVWILAVAQTFATAGTIIFITYGGILGTELAPRRSLATLPMALAIVGIAMTSIPAALLMQRIGRRAAFIGSAMIASLAAMLCALSVSQHSFVGFCVAALLFGVNMAFVQQYRFAAADMVPPQLTGRAVSTVMLGTLAAALLWPEVGDRMRLVGAWPEFTGSFLAVALLCLVAVVFLLQLPALRFAASTTTDEARPLAQILRNPMTLIAIAAGACAYAVMSFIMTATPISMHTLDAMSVADTKRVISTHLIAMYLPALISGWFIHVLGLVRMMLLGVLCMTACVLISCFVGHHYVHYLSGLALLGVGWNFLFVAGTTLLTTSYAPADRFRAQGCNDFAVFGSQALASAAAGPIVLAQGWERLNWLALPVLAAMLVGVGWSARSTVRKHVS